MVYSWAKEGKVKNCEKVSKDFSILLNKKDLTGAGQILFVYGIHRRGSVY